MFFSNEMVTCSSLHIYLIFPSIYILCFAANQVAAARFYWNDVCTRFMLRCFVDIVAQEQKTDKGFKDVHLNQVARMVTTFSGRLCTGQQVYGHLRFWQTRWARVCKLKAMSGVGWDEDNFMITLDADYYEAVVKAHPKDAEFLNRPIVNYYQMQEIFGSGVAIGKYAMGSAEALRRPGDASAHIDVEACERGEEPMAAPTLDRKPKEESKMEEEQRAPKRRNQEGGGSSNGGLTEASNIVAEAKGCKGIYYAVMDVPGFSRDELMCALDHFMERKGAALVFMDMTKSDRQLWFQRFLAKHYN